MGALQSPSLVGVIQMGLAVVGHCFAIAVDSDCRVVILGVRRPVQRRIYLFGVSHDDGAVMLEGCIPSPERADTRAGFFKMGRYVG